MKEKLNHLLEEGRERIAAVKSETELQEIKAVLLGKQGSLTQPSAPRWARPSTTRRRS